MVPERLLHSVLPLWQLRNQKQAVIGNRRVQPMEYPKQYGPDEVPEAVLELLERLLPALVEGGHPALVALQQQVPHLRVTKAEMTGVEFFVHFDLDRDVPLAQPPTFAGGDAIIRLAGETVQAGCVLFVRDGRIAMLEGYTYGDDKWAEDAQVVSVEAIIPIHPP